MKELIKKIHSLLIKNKKTLACAESCTSGLLSHYLTYLGGSSKFFILGITAYSNEAKIKLLKIKKEIILKKGAVSKEVSLLMAKNVKELANVDIGISITGIAGPSGGTPKKPKGTVYISIAYNNKALTRKFLFKGSRNTIKQKTVKKALILLKNILK